MCWRAYYFSAWSLKTYFPSIKPTLEAPTGPINGIPEIASAAEDAIIDKISDSFYLS